MKPTDEAKRLREEIVLTISNSEPFTSEYFDDLDYKLIGSIAEKSINKVLDVAYEAVANAEIINACCMTSTHYALDEIDKLRP